MMVDSVLSVGVTGIQNGVRKAQQAANEIAGANVADRSQDDLTESMVDLKMSEIQVEASAAVVKTADDMLGTLLDTKA
jgi:flagellar basal body rod protein FlgG